MTATLRIGDFCRVAGREGIAFEIVDKATYWTEGKWTLVCDLNHESGLNHGDSCYAWDEPEEVEEVDRCVVVMVGDDVRYVHDWRDLVPLSEDDFCIGCGQTGCTAGR